MALLTKVGDVVYGNDGTWQSDDPHFIGIWEQTIELCRFTDSRVTIVAVQQLGTVDRRGDVSKTSNLDLHSELHHPVGG